MKKENNNVSELTSLHDKLRYIQVNLNAPKNAVNKFGGYQYRKAEDILAAVKPYLNELNLVLTINTEVQFIGSHYYFVCTASITDSSNTISAKALAREDESQKGMNSSQLSGSCTSYAKKYALGNLFAIDDEKDADTNEFHQQTQQPSAPHQQQPSSSSANEQIAIALQEINAAKDRTELTRIWNAYPHLREYPAFKTPIEIKSKQLPSK